MEKNICALTCVIPKQDISSNHPTLLFVILLSVNLPKNGVVTLTSLKEGRLLHMPEYKKTAGQGFYTFCEKISIPWAAQSHAVGNKIVSVQCPQTLCLHVLNSSHSKLSAAIFV